MRSAFKFFLLTLVCLGTLQALGTQFLTVPVTARELTVITTPWRNPALGEGRGLRPEMGFSYGQWLAGIRSFSFQYQQKRLTLRLRSLGSQDLELRTSRPTDRPVGKFGASGTAVEGAFRRKWGKLDFGLGFKMVYFQIYTQTASGFGLDLGLRLPISGEGYATLAVLNLGGMTPLQNQRPVMPRRIIAGFGKRSVVLGLRTETAINVEHSVLVDGFILDMGHQLFYRSLVISNTFRKHGKQWSYGGGIGIHFGIYSLYYGFRTGTGSLGTPQMMDISILLP